MGSGSQTSTQKRYVEARCQAGSGVAPAAPSGGSMRPQQALSKLALLWHGTNRLVGVRLTGARPVGKKKQGGEARSPPDGWMQNSQAGCGRGAHSGLGLLWQVCSQWCAQEEEEVVQVRGDRGALTVCMAVLVLSPPKVFQSARW